MPEIVTRAEALEQGLTYYFTGKPCKHGHLVKRLTSAGRCCECARNAALDRLSETGRGNKIAVTRSPAVDEIEYRARRLFCAMMARMPNNP